VGSAVGHWAVTPDGPNVAFERAASAIEQLYPADL
jgi:hypothetical protein